MAICYSSELDKVFHALGDGSRRLILATLAKNSRCTASELVDLFDVAQPTISKHLKVLEAAQLVHRTVEGRRHYFSLNAAGLGQVDDWLARHRSLWNNSLDRLECYLFSEAGSGHSGDD